MTGLLDRLQLRPQERRIVVVGALVLFLLLNLWFVWPHFGDHTRSRNQRRTAERTLDRYRQEVSRTNEYIARLKELEREGTGLLTSDSDLLLISTIQTLARSAEFSAGKIDPAARLTRPRTNEFYEQRTLTVGINPNPPQPLVNFLLAIASNQVVMRVKELDLKPDPSRTKLTGSLKVVASFQKTSLTRPEAAAPAVTKANPRT